MQGRGIKIVSLKQHRDSKCLDRTRATTYKRDILCLLTMIGHTTPCTLSWGIHIYIYAQTYIHTYIHRYIHTYIHTYVANAVRAPSARVSASAPPYPCVWSRLSHFLNHLTHALFPQ